MALIEQGTLLGEPRDIGLLTSYVRQDVTDEDIDEIKDLLWKHHNRAIMKVVCGGVAKWYLRKLERGDIAELLDDGS